MSTLLRAEHVVLIRGERVILGGVGLSVASGERVALLGRNGAGKTTLLDVLAGKLRPDEGELWRAAEVRLAELPQQPTFEGGASVAELAAAANPNLARQGELAALAARLEHDPGLLPRWAEAQSDFEARGGYRYQTEAARTLGVLGLQGLEARVAAGLSGGERTRLALALALLSRPDVLLLDEPTNHLDVRMREWLQSALLAWPGGVVLTSHDREVLDRVATRSLWLEGWLEGGTATSYPGGYSRARAQRDLARRTRERAARLGEREAARLSGAASQESRWGRRPEALRARANRVAAPEAPPSERRARMRLLSGSARADLLVSAEHLSKTYGERVILEDVALKIRRGDRVVLLGPNGAGKTTLLRLLSGDVYSDDPRGRLRYEAGVVPALLDQTWHGLLPDRPVLAQFEARFGEGRAKGLLGAAGFSGALWTQTPRDLSGGERARAGLALIGASRADLLLLDEPTNHLDVEALEGLEGALLAYGGASLIVTHDRRLAREVATRLWRLEDGRLLEQEGWNAKVTLDPARALVGDPLPAPAPPTPRRRLIPLEERLTDLGARLVFGHLTGREEARVRREQRRLRAELGALYDEVYGAELFDHEVREGPLRVRGLKLGAGGQFWARGARDCPHLAWSGEVLTWQGERTQPWFAGALLRGALRILFEHWAAEDVTFPGGRVLPCQEYFAAEGLLH